MSLPVTDLFEARVRRARNPDEWSRLFKENCASHRLGIQELGSIWPWKSNAAKRRLDRLLWELDVLFHYKKLYGW